MKTKKISLLVFIGLILAAVGLAALSYFGIGRRGTLGMENIKQGLDLQGGVAIVYEAAIDNPTTEQMLSVQSLIRDRLDRRGWTEAEVALQGNRRIRIDVPGVDDAETAISEIGRTAKLTFRDSDGNVLVDGADVVNAKKDVIQKSQGAPVQSVVSIEFNSQGAADFEQATQDNLNKPLYIMLDEDTISAPNVSSVISGGSAYIEGNFTPESAEELAALIRAGSLPFNLNVISMSNIGAKLGANSLETSLLAGIIGVALAILFMLGVYRVAGIIADIALFIYIGLLLVLISALEVTLTLPGIAGIILSTGMAIDANIIIFERLKEELRAGKTMRTAIDAAFSRAFTAIFDSNATTLICAAVLFWLGTGPVKGFAQTLSLGVVVSMFTAIFITKLLLRCVSGMGFDNPSLYRINMNSKTAGKFRNIVEQRIKYFIISAALLAIGLVVMVVNAAMGKGMFNFDVEFTGGLSIAFDMGNDDFKNDDISAVITGVTGQTSPQVQRVTGTNVVNIKIRSIEQETRIELIDTLTEKYPDMVVDSMDDVSATVSGEMQATAVLALAASCAAMLVYIAVRFRNFKLGGAVIVSVLHDGLIAIVVYAILRIPVNYSFIAAVLTVVGYSINATIVIFDRIRENKKLYPSKPMAELINLSVWQSMTRSVYTTISTLFTITCIAIFGVQSIREFSIPIIIGIAFGLYSSICLSGALWYTFSKGLKETSNRN